MWRPALTALLLALSACGGPEDTPEQRIRQLIDGMELAVESGSVKSAAEWLHNDYADRWHPDRRAAVRSLFGYLRRHDDIHLLTVIRSITVTPAQDTANAVVYLAMSGTPVESPETLISVKADLYRFDLELAVVDGDWRVLSAHWAPATEAAFAR
jgi:hypothetical protein